MSSGKQRGWLVVAVNWTYDDQYYSSEGYEATGGVFLALADAKAEMDKREIAMWREANVNSYLGEDGIDDGADLVRYFIKHGRMPDQAEAVVNGLANDDDDEETELSVPEHFTDDKVRQLIELVPQLRFFKLSEVTIR
jgi:hypothetical protein